MTTIPFRPLFGIYALAAVLFLGAAAPTFAGEREFEVVVQDLDEHEIGKKPFEFENILGLQLKLDEEEVDEYEIQGYTIILSSGSNDMKLQNRGSKIQEDLKDIVKSVALMGYDRVSFEDIRVMDKKGGQYWAESIFVYLL